MKQNNKPFEEEWRRCQYPFVRYEVSNQGNLRHIHNKKNRKLRENYRGGYLCTNIRVGGKNKPLYIHKQVALCFCDGWAEGKEVNHKNGIKHDNRAENLEWVKRSENSRHARYKLGLQVKPVGLFDERGHLRLIFPSANDCNRRCGGKVQDHIRKRYRFHGYHPHYMNWVQYTMINHLVQHHHYTPHAAYVEACMD